mmetsp:Transcript_11791/g.11726  ORF Transcript_11791/g.11726 Transcript_11791/m.11726 type:complete len:165 (-) Transcript_11791:35-529(-)
MHVQFDDRNGNERDHYYCEYESSNIEELYYQFFLASGAYDVDTRCINNVRLEWYIIVFAIVLPLLIIIIILFIVCYCCYQQYNSHKPPKKARLYELNQNNSTMNMSQTFHQDQLRNDMDKLGVMKAKNEQDQQEIIMQELARRIMYHNELNRMGTMNQTGASFT